MTWGIGVTATLLLCGLYAARMVRQEGRARNALVVARRTGMLEPPSLHPVIDAAVCIGCGSCVDACPEGGVLGVVDGTAVLVEPTSCIGHGACKAACPTGALELVFGTATRGVEIPTLRPNFETNVPGVFIAGELGGMGLIRNAIEQGRQAIESVRVHPTPEDAPKTDGELDVLIVGAGPAGFAASLTAMQHSLRYRTIEQDTLGGTVAHYPRGKIVMTAPVKLPLVGKVRMTETTKEDLLAFWIDVERRTGVEIRYRERLESLQPVDGGFVATTTCETYRARTVLLAVGRRGTPRQLGVSGENLSKVTYSLVDPQQYRESRVLVVGGGDSALEAACSIAEEHGTRVTLSYRGQAFGRAKPKNRERVQAATASGRLTTLLQSELSLITPDSVQLQHQGRPVELANDAVIVCAGGIPPSGFLRSIGVDLEMKRGTA